MSYNKPAIATRKAHTEHYAVVLEKRASVGGNDGERQSPSAISRHKIGLIEIRRTAFASLQGGIAAGVLMFYSKSVLGAAIRALLGV